MALDMDDSYYDMDDSSDGSSGDENPLKKCFAVEIPRNFNPNICPTTGEEFLQLAMYEAKQCQATITVPIDSKKLKPPTHSLNKDNCGQADYLKILLPLSWKNEKVYEFGRFHKYIQKALRNKPPKHQPFEIEYWSVRLNENPTFSEAIKLDAYNQLCLLEMISKELQYIQSGSTISDTMGCWIHTILSLLQIPLSPSLYGILRELANRFSEIRSKLGANVSFDVYAPLNVFICIIGVYYGQFDVADNYTV